MSEYVTITIKLNRKLAESIEGFERAIAVARTRCDAYENVGDANSAASEEREVHRIQGEAAPFVDQVERDARAYAKIENIAISEMPAWRIQFCRADSSVAMVEFLARDGY